MKRIFSLFILLALLGFSSVTAQVVTGVVIDSSNGDPVPYANIYYKGKNIATVTDLKGNYKIPFVYATLVFSSVSYKTREVAITKPQHLNMTLEIKPFEVFSEVVGNKKKYSRQNNPAVELMRKVIAAKKLSDLTHHDYYTIDKYQKITFAFNEVDTTDLNNKFFKRVPFLKSHIEISPETKKNILPLSVDEKVTKEFFRKRPERYKTIIKAQRSKGINELFNTGDILTTILQDCFTDINLYDNNVRVFQYQFVSPLSSSLGIKFYRYFIEDTTYVGKDKCIEVTFTPNNPQDFGFSGSLFIKTDSTYSVRRAIFGIPKRSDVNFVEDLLVDQEFKKLNSGEYVLSKDNMLVQLKIFKFLQKFQVKRTTDYTSYNFDPVDDKIFKPIGAILTDPDARMHNENYWEEYRIEPLTKSEGKMDLLIKKLERVKGFKSVLFTAKAFIENFVETSSDPKNPSKVDIGPVNTSISQNTIDGLRLRLSAQSTANLNPHLFLKGYGAYGFRDHRWKGLGEFTYSFNKKAYLPREFPVNNITVSYKNDVMAPSDKFIPTDKDNVFTSVKWSDVEHMMYFKDIHLLYDREWGNGLRVKLRFKYEENNPTGDLFYQTLSASGTPSEDTSTNIEEIKTSDVMLGIIYQPGATFINTKQRRITINNDAPIFSFYHTLGLKNVFGSDYNYNFTEAGIYKRFFIPASWGKIDTYIKGGVQWNKVPFPLLIMPASNLSYIMEDGTFSLIDNMEFLNDRYASLMVSWDMNGKIFNRIPLIKKLKWREFIGCNVLWGSLSDKNNPFLEKNKNDGSLFYFPGRFDNGEYVYSSKLMDRNKPYVELIAGIHNIFKVFHVEYIRRLNYLGTEGTNKWGIRFMFRITF